MNAKIITVAVVTASAVLNYLLTQPAGTFSQQTLLIFGAVSVALTVVARYLPTDGTTQKVEITTPVPVTETPAEPTDG